MTKLCAALDHASVLPHPYSFVAATAGEDLLRWVCRKTPHFWLISHSLEVALDKSLFELTLWAEFQNVGASCSDKEIL